MIFDFHTHTVLSDGELSPVELVRRAMVNGYRAMAITDHAAMGTVERITKELIVECDLVMRYWGMVALPGVELTHVPAAAIAECAAHAKALGARVVIVHGETTVEPVEPGTNRAALLCPDVDILAHPGLLTPEEAEIAAERNVFLELSARRGHSLCNGHVAVTALKAGARLVLDSDAHAPGDLLTEPFAQMVVRGAGIPPELLANVLRENPLLLLKKVGITLPD
ncbi:MAG: histidinol phosphate phosphatase domain-containing protein [Dehalococcoidia bacterium]|nr:histidinol phosphate phosphatase domain-containing protein [Dehalococcoidia bacterium]